LGYERRWSKVRFARQSRRDHLAIRLAYGIWEMVAQGVKTLTIALGAGVLDLSVDGRLDHVGLAALALARRLVLCCQSR
jgi:hypothetical protein